MSDVELYAKKWYGWNLDFVEKSAKLERELWAAQCRIAELEAANRWISVEERLPDDNYDDNGDESIVYMPSLNIVMPAEFVEGRWWSCHGSIDWTDSVTHWRPMPEIPEVQS